MTGRRCAVGTINRQNTTPTSHSATDDALRALVRLLARQAARDPCAGSPVPVNLARHEEVKDEQA